MAIAVPRSLTLECVSSGSRTFSFREPLELEVASSNSVWTLRHSTSGLNSYGESLEEALERFAEDVAYTWDVYAQQPDSVLGPLAQYLKLQLLALVADVG
jgi:hypothetical protein